MPRSRSRGATRRPLRQQKTSVLIATNGALTEHVYLKEIKQRVQDSRLAIRVEFLNGETGSMLRKLSSPHGDTSSYDEVWLVVDEDGADRESLLRDCVERTTRRQRWVAVISRPCFEVWLVAHYTQVRRYMDQRDAQRHYRQLVPEGLPEKDLPKDFPYSAAGEAVLRSRLPGDELESPDILPPSPGTAMPHLLTRLGLVEL